MGWCITITTIINIWQNSTHITENHLKWLTHEGGSKSAKNLENKCLDLLNTFAYYLFPYQLFSTVCAFTINVSLD